MSNTKALDFSNTWSELCFHISLRKSRFHKPQCAYSVIGNRSTNKLREQFYLSGYPYHKLCMFSLEDLCWVCSITVDFIITERKHSNKSLWPMGHKIVHCYIAAFTHCIFNSIKVITDVSFNENFCLFPEESLITSCFFSISSKRLSLPVWPHNFPWVQLVSQSDLVVTNSVGSIKQLSVATSIENEIKAVVEGPVNLHLEENC